MDMHLFWIIAWSIAIFVFVAFTFVIMFGAPFLPTLTPQVKNALDMIDLQPGQTLLELGSGNGKVMIAAAERGIRVIGYELNPVLVVYSWLRTRKYKGRVTVKWANFWYAKLPPTDGIFVFLLQPYMNKLNTKIEQECSKPVKLVSFAFYIPDREPAVERMGMRLYLYK
jgi:16S rRNA A1518/A1519 N6-dimethyltransferase RsmA/KsgA/DIM1 with predicted DNA glycosylase/AP lyase activity